MKRGNTKIESKEKSSDFFHDLRSWYERQDRLLNRPETTVEETKLEIEKGGEVSGLD